MQTLKQLKNKIKQSQETLCDNVNEFKEHFANKFSQLIGKYVFINNDYVKITNISPYMSVDIEDYRKIEDLCNLVEDSYSIFVDSEFTTTLTLFGESISIRKKYLELRDNYNINISIEDIKDLKYITEEEYLKQFDLAIETIIKLKNSKT